MEDSPTNDLLTESNENTNIETELNVNSEQNVAKPRHRKVASNEGRFNCEECEATFSLAKDVTRHKKSKHEGEVVEALCRC